MYNTKITIRRPANLHLKKQFKWHNIRCFEHIATYIDIRCNLFFMIVGTFYYYYVSLHSLILFFMLAIHVCTVSLVQIIRTSSFSFLFSDRSFLIISFGHIFQDLHHSFASIYTFIDSCKYTYYIFCFISLFFT